MNIREILDGNVVSPSLEEQKEVLDQMKEDKIFDLNSTEKLNLTSFLCEKAETELAIDYLFHVLDNEISYPMDDEKVKDLFSTEGMCKLKDLMMEKLQDDISEEEEVGE
jgi:hypothetical protein